MLHTKPQGHWLFGSGGGDFLRVFTIYGRGGHLGRVTQTPQTNLRPPSPLPTEAPYEIWLLIDQAVSEKKIFENGGRRTDGRRTMAIL